MKRITFDIHNALESLYPEDGEYMQEGLDYSGLTWTDGSRPKPSEAKLNSEIIRLQEEYDSQEYARNRKTEYDALNQFELISDDTNNGTTTHIDAINAIKTKYPKP